jgi:hypothetical protein
MKKTFMRSPYNLGTHHPPKFDYPVSVVEVEGYESLDILVERFMRGEIIPPRPVGYDVSANMTDDEAFDMEDPTASDGFDISDLPPLKDGINAVLSQKKVKARGKPATPRATANMAGGGEQAAPEPPPSESDPTA